MIDYLLMFLATTAFLCVAGVWKVFRPKKQVAERIDRFRRVAPPPSKMTSVRRPGRPTK